VAGPIQRVPEGSSRANNIPELAKQAQPTAKLAVYTVRRREIMRRSPIWMARSLAILMLAGSVTAASAQSDQEHDAHHPDGSPAAESGPAAQASPDEEQPGMGGMGQQGQGMMGQGMMGSGMGMNPEMMQMMQQMMGERQGGMGPGMMGQRGPRMGMMGHGGMMRVMFAIMDADGDGFLSREEFQEAHGRIFNHMDADGDGQVTLEDMQAFMGGSAMPSRQMPVRQGRQMEHTLSESAQAYMDAMQTMMDGMASMEMTGDAARDFALMMIPHHQSAVDMAEAFLQHSDDPELTRLANEIVSTQQEEIEFLQNWLGENR
jgi:Ca2+-binding EF-hand superfamily protein